MIQTDTTPKACPVCGEIFTPSRTHLKYCSVACADIAKAEKQRIRNQKRSIMGAEYSNNIDIEAHMDAKRRKQAEMQQQTDKRRADAKTKLRADAAAGNIFAQMKLAMHNGDTIEYWRLRKEYYLAECKRCNIPLYECNFIVGGVSVLEPDFENIVGAI